ncbi:type III effector Hrp-dependent outer, partial [mine drainage metagenome]
SPLYAYYGDDFTGSTDVLEALASAGVPSVLFVGTPSEAQRARFAGCRAFGIAGDSRSRDPEWMSEHLPALFRSLGALGAPLVHYKTCSTFDSSPEIGSIGRALEIGRGVIAGAVRSDRGGRASLGRYLVFGNLFAVASGVVHRIDRHPTMRSHPVTPMYEADLRRHLAAQTALRIGSVELPALARG